MLNKVVDCSFVLAKELMPHYLINNCQFTADEMDAFFAELAK